MGTMQVALALIIVLGISDLAKGFQNGASGGVGRTYYGYRYPYYRGSATTVPNGSHSSGYGGLGYNLGRWGNGLGGSVNYGSHYPMPSPVNPVSKQAYNPTGGYFWYSPSYYRGSTNTVPHSSLSPVYGGSGYNLGRGGNGIGSYGSYGSHYQIPSLNNQVSKQTYNPTGGAGRGYFWYSPSYYRGSTNNVSNLSYYPLYRGLTYNLGRGGHGLGGLGSYGSHYSMFSPVGQIPRKAYYPTGYYRWGGYGQQYPVNAMSQILRRSGGWTSGQINRGQGAHVSQLPVRYLGYSMGQPSIKTYRVIYPRRSPVGSRFRNIPSGYNFRYPAATSGGYTPQSVLRPVASGLGNLRVSQPVRLGLGNSYSGYGSQYQSATSGSHTPQYVPIPVNVGLGNLRVSQPVRLGFGNSYSGYGSQYPSATSGSHTLQYVPIPVSWGSGNLRVSQPVRPGFGNPYSGYGSQYPSTTSGSQTPQYVPSVGWGLGNMRVSQPVRLGFGNPYSGYGSNYPSTTSVSHTPQSVPHPAGWGVRIMYVAQPISLGFGNSYSGYGSHYPYASSVSNTPMNLLGLGSLHGGWNGYGRGYGVNYPTGASYGGWGLGGLSGGNGAYHPLAYSLGNVSHGAQPTSPYGKYGHVGGIQHLASTVSHHPISHGVSGHSG